MALFQKGSAGAGAFACSCLLRSRFWDFRSSAAETHVSRSSVPVNEIRPPVDYLSSAVIATQKGAAPVAGAVATKSRLTTRFFGCGFFQLVT